MNIKRFNIYTEDVLGAEYCVTSPNNRKRMPTRQEVEGTCQLVIETGDLVLFEPEKLRLTVDFLVRSVTTRSDGDGYDLELVGTGDVSGKLFTEAKSLTDKGPRR